MSSSQSGSDDPRLDWGPGEWHEEVQRVEAERDHYREALRYIQDRGYTGASFVAMKALAGKDWT